MISSNEPEREVCRMIASQTRKPHTNIVIPLQYMLFGSPFQHRSVHLNAFTRDLTSQSPLLPGTRLENLDCSDIRTFCYYHSNGKFTRLVYIRA